MNTFWEIKGNAPLKKQLKHSMESGHVSHAYLFYGAKGMGKKTMANAFAKALECTDSQGDACGNCVSCRSFDTKNHPDVIYVTPTKTKALGVEDVREQVIKQVEIKQYKYQYKIFIIDHADTMSVAAQNALLKTLEEPPPYGIFLLLAENLDGLLPTVLSRVVLLKVSPLSKEVLEGALLEKQVATEETVGLLAEYAQGSLGQALELAASQQFIEMREAILSRLVQMNQMDLFSVMMLSKEWESYKDNQQFLDILYLWYRDLLVQKQTKESVHVIQKDKISLLETQVGKETFLGLQKKLDAVWEAKRRLSQNANFQLTMEVMLMKLKES